MRKGIILGMMLLLLITFASAATRTYVETFNVTLGATNNVGITGSQIRFDGVTIIYSNATFKVEFNQTVTLINQSTSILYEGLLEDGLVIFNGSSDTTLPVDLYGGNASLNNATGVVTWNLTGGGVSGWNGYQVKVNYNKTFVADSSILSNSFSTSTYAGRPCGSQGGFILSNPSNLQSNNLDNKAWNVTYTVSDCSNYWTGQYGGTERLLIYIMLVVMAVGAMMTITTGNVSYVLIFIGLSIAVILISSVL